MTHQLWFRKRVPPKDTTNLTNLQKQLQFLFDCGASFLHVTIQMYKQLQKFVATLEVRQQTTLATP